MKEFNGKAIYKPKGKAGEYAEWACNFYVGCSNGCEYCYCKKGVLAKQLGGDTPTLKKCFKDEKHAIEVFQREIEQNLEELQKSGLFFTFTSDPLLPSTRELFTLALDFATDYDIPVKLLTKRADWVEWLLPRLPINRRDLYAFGFTLTGRDDLEPYASTNAERIEAMEKMYNAGFKTFASIEPIVDLNSATDMIDSCIDFCNLYKVGLMSGGKYDKKELREFIENLSTYCDNRFYLKNSLIDAAGYTRDNLPVYDNRIVSCWVDSKYDIFNN